MTFFSRLISFFTVQSHAYRIAGLGNYEHIRSELAKKDLFPKYIRLVQEKYSDIFKRAKFSPTQEDWEMLAILWLYDADIAEHSVRTFSLAHKLITQKFSHRGGQIVLRSVLEKYSVTAEQFLRASLFHDIGKIALPREVVNNTLNDKEMGDLFVRMLRGKNRKAVLADLGLSKEDSPEEALEHLFEMGLRPKDAVPVREIFKGKESHVLNVIKKNGFSEEETLGEIISRHEKEGSKLFEKADPIVAQIILHHHPGVRLPRKRKKEEGRLYILEFMLALVDEFDAFGHQRSYKKALPKIGILFELTREVKNGRLDRGVTALWVEHEYKKIPAKERTEKYRSSIDYFLADPKNEKAIEKFG